MGKEGSCRCCCKYGFAEERYGFKLHGTSASIVKEFSVFLSGAKEKSNILRLRTQTCRLHQGMPGMLDGKGAVKPMWKWLFDGLENEPDKSLVINILCLMTNITPEFANGLSGDSH